MAQQTSIVYLPSSLIWTQKTQLNSLIPTKKIKLTELCLIQILKSYTSLLLFLWFILLFQKQWCGLFVQRLKCLLILRIFIDIKQIFLPVWGIKCSNDTRWADFLQKLSFNLTRVQSFYLLIFYASIFSREIPNTWMIKIV